MPKLQRVDTGTGHRGHPASRLATKRVPNPPHTHLPPRQQQNAARPMWAAMPHYIPGRGWMASRVPPVRGALLPVPAPARLPAPTLPLPGASTNIYAAAQGTAQGGKDPAANIFGFVAAVSFGGGTNLKWFLNNTPSIPRGHAWQPWECITQSDTET